MKLGLFLTSHLFLTGLGLALGAPLVAAAEGFANKDLGSLTVTTEGYQGGTMTHGSNEPQRLTVFCTDCDGIVSVDLQLGRSEDDTEGRYRSGETTIEGMEALCKQRAASCEMVDVSVGRAVGWASTYETPIGAGSTTVLFLDGDMLVIRSIASDVPTAAANGAFARATLAPQIIGAE